MGLLNRMFSNGTDAAVADALPPQDPPLDLGKPMPDTTTYVVGDIHGRNDLFERILGQIDLDIGRFEVGNPVLVMLGDYVDRGEDSATVLARMQQLNMATPERFICLMGNHERMMLDFLHKPDRRGSRWLRHGGLQTLASYGIGGVSEASSASALEDAAEKLAAALPAGMLVWLKRLRHSWTSGTLVCTHAALDPALPLEEQTRRTMLWGHAEFFDKPRTDGLWVAHGHTVIPSPRVEQSRISLDTGAYVTGTLCAAKITPEGAVKFLET